MQNDKVAITEWNWLEVVCLGLCPVALAIEIIFYVVQPLQ
jgi:hypothetical protein